MSGSVRLSSLVKVLGALCALEAVAFAQPDTQEPDAPPPSPTAPPPGSKPAAGASLGIAGTVESPELEAPLAGATVTIPGTAYTATTDDDGHFTLAVPPGNYTVHVDFAGFKSDDKQVKVIPGAPGAVVVAFKLGTATLLNETIVVVGSRTPRTNIDTTVPVDVITAEEVQRVGDSETSRILSDLEPSFISTPQTISDGTDHVDPAALRGLGPDQVLVLVNGKRRHKSALLNVNGTFGRGTVGTDLNAIAPGSIKRIEVLRDGAAAQYGSDAIAGVINIVTKDATDVVDVTTEAGITASGDGMKLTASANGGWKLGDRGFLNVTGEFMQRGATNRTGTYTGPIYDANNTAAQDDAILSQRGLTRDDLKMKIGEAAATFGVGSYNMELPFSDTAKVYSFGDVSYRRGDAAGFYRFPYQTNENVASFYPNGFLPEIHTNIQDTSFTVGVRQKGDWTVDASLTRGTSQFRFDIENTVNASLGTASPTSFNAGTLQSTETVANLDLQRKLDTDAVKSVSLVLGSEFRVENYQILAGDVPSFEDGMAGDAPNAIPGAQVFPGFQPSNEVDKTRDAIGVYGGVESDITKALAVDVGGRFEAYSDFGQNVTGKLATRYRLLDTVSLRGAISTGFRAPSLQQLYFSNVSTQFLPDSMGNLQAQQVLTSNNDSPVTKAFGIPSLHEERSINGSGGITIRPNENLSITADGYYIRINGRIVLTSDFSSSNAIVAGILQPFPGVSEAQFFANAIDTNTYGADLVADYATPVGDGTLTFTGGANFTTTQVANIHLPRALVDKFGANSTDLTNFYFDRASRNRIEDSVPHQKGIVSLRYALEHWSFLLRSRYYGAVYFKPDDPTNDETFGAKVLFDTQIGYQVTKTARFSIGGDNLLNTFPDKQTKAANISDGRFIYSRNVSQFGENGGFYYVKLELSFL
jgi:iron complex outermembrane receptor protein